jgi:hypothetical protein
MAFWFASFLVAWLFMACGDHYILAAFWILFTNAHAGPAMRALTETELHVDEAAHQVDSLIGWLVGPRAGKLSGDLQHESRSDSQNVPGAEALVPSKYLLF